MFTLRFLLPILAATALQAVSAQVVINEIHYHPVENPRFDTAGNPIYPENTPADLTDDVHEFVEIHNAGARAIDLSGWRLTSGIDFTFDPGTLLPVGGFKVIAKNPGRIQNVYGITGALGPYAGVLSNKGDTVRLLDAAGTAVDAVTYGSDFPWPISADALGASDDFTGLDSATYQYKGRSLQRVSATAPANDPANWIAVRLASNPVTFADQPTPGAENIVSRNFPKPVVTEYLATQASDGAAIIRATQQVKITCSFSSMASPADVQVEYFVENMNAFNEVKTTVTMTASGNGQFIAMLPGQPNRTLVRYRIKANLGDGLEVVAPRVDDPAVVQVGAPTYQASPPKRLPARREAWYAWFVSPVRTSTRQIYDVLVPTDGTANEARFNGLNGFQSLAYSSNGSPKRVTSTDISGQPREIPKVLPTDRLWNDTVPGVFVNNGIVRDIQIRYHGSRYNRNPGRKSFKVFFAEYLPFRDGAGNEITSVFETDKTDYFMTAHGLHQLAGLPLSTVRYVDWYFNTDSVITRLEQGEYNGELLDAYHEKMQRLNPGSVKEETGEYYKSVGFIISPNTAGEGPYGSGNEWRLPASGPWTELQRFDYTYSLQNHNWKGAKPIKDTVNGMWTARGDTHTAPNPNLVNLKAWFQANWDVDTELTSMALGNWMCPWDDTTQNHFLWRRANGKWVRLLWDFDAMYGTGDGTSSSSSIYLGEVGNANNNSRGPNYVKDGFIKAFRNEFKERMWFLNNTLLDPENLQTLTYVTASGASSTYHSYINGLAGGFAANRFTSVNSQVALGIFYKPTRPTAAAPANGAAVLPGVSLTTSAYGYNAASTHTAAPSVSPHTFTKWEIRTAAGNYDDPIYLAKLGPPNLTALPIPFGQLTFGQTYFWRATYFDALGHPSITSAERSFSYGPTSTTAGNVVLNEIMADNRSAVANATTYPDYVELKNNTALEVDLTGWTLTDDELVPNKYAFPAGTKLPASGYLVIWCDSDVLLPGLHAGFGLNDRGQRVILIQAGVVRDAISFGPQVPDLPIGRIANGTGAWNLNDPSIGAANVAHAFGTDATSLKFNEWMADPLSGSDWFELFNPDAAPIALGSLWLSDTPATPKITQIPALTFIEPNGFTKFNADGTTDGFNSVNFKLGGAGDDLILTTTNGLTTLAAIQFGAQERGISQGRFPDGNAVIHSFPQSPSPGESNWLPAPVVINEALTNSTPPLGDTIELFNGSADPVDIGGWWLSDDIQALRRFQIPPGTTLPAGGFAVFLESQFNPAPGAGTSFSLDALGEKVILSAVDGGGVLTGYRAQVSFGAALDGVPFGRVNTGNLAGATTPEFWPLVARTFGLVNAAPKTGPIVINEVMYHPADFPPILPGTDNGRDEFIELHNLATSPQNLAGWRLRGDVDCVFGVGATIRPGEYALVVSFNPATDSVSLNAFLAAYNLPANATIFGPYAPRLSNSTANIELGYASEAVGGITPFIRVDKIEYTDAAPWPVAPDGTGHSLQRLSRAQIGSDVGNWTAETPTPGNVNVGQTPLLDSDGDGLPDAWETANGLDRFDGTDAAMDADGDGQGNFAEYLSGTNPRNAGDVLKAEVSAAVPGPGFVVRFTAKAGRAYVVEFKDALTDADWQTLATIPAPASDTTIERADPTAQPQRFYRVKVPGF